MADQSDVEVALVRVAAAALYPNGTDAPSVPGADCRVYRGWPTAAALDSDLAAGRINVTVFPLPDDTCLTTRYSQVWQGVPAVPALQAVVNSSTVSLSGTADSGQIIGILADRRAYAYRTEPGDTPALVAAKLATQARSDWIVQLTGCAFTLCGAVRVLARVVTDVPVFKEARRQQQGFRITCWCPTPATRDITAAAIDSALALVTFIDLPDGSSARLRYKGTSVFDQSQDALLYRRDLLFQVEYPTIVARDYPTMLFGDLGLNADRLTA